MSEEMNIPVKLKNPVGFFSEYHKAELFLFFEGSYSVMSENPEGLGKMKSMSELVESQFISAFHSALTLISESGNIYELLSDCSVFDTITAYMQVCLEEWYDDYGTSLLKVNPVRVYFDDESISVIRISDEMRNSSIAEVSNIPREVPNRLYRTESAGTWKCGSCGCINDSNFCKDCGSRKPEPWICICGIENTGLFCVNCGTSAQIIWKCSCGSVNKGNFCPICGSPKNN